MFFSFPSRQNSEFFIVLLLHRTTTYSKKSIFYEIISKTFNFNLIEPPEHHANMPPKVLPPAHQVVPPYATCKTLKLPLSLMCSVCYDNVNPLIHRRKPRKTERCKSNRRQCKELWLRSNYTSSLTPGKRTKHRLQCRWLGCDFVKQDEKLSKEQPSAHQNGSKSHILNETKQPSLDEPTAPAKTLLCFIQILLHARTTYAKPIILLCFIIPLAHLMPQPQIILANLMPQSQIMLANLMPQPPIMQVNLMHQPPKMQANLIAQPPIMRANLIPWLPIMQANLMPQPPTM